MPTDIFATLVSQGELKAMYNFWELFKTVKLPEPPASPPEAPKPEAPKERTKALGIVVDTPLLSGRNYWKFFGTNYGTPVGCRDDPIRTDERAPRHGELVYEERALPGGEFALDLFGENCTYKNSGDNMGKLFCGDAWRTIDCYWDPYDGYPVYKGGMYWCEFATKVLRRTMMTCPY